MNSKAKICISIIVIIFLIVICLVSFRNNDSEETIVDEVSNVVNEVEEIENEVAIDEVVNEVANEVVTTQAKPDDSKLSTQDFSASVYEDKTDTGTLSKKQEAIELVKEEWNKWGEDNSVTFSVDSITNDGIYIVAVTSKEKAEVLNYYRVNVKTKTVAVDY